MIYTETIKKEMRSIIYDWADQISNEISNSRHNTNHTRMELEFLNGIKEGNLKLCLECKNNLV